MASNKPIPCGPCHKGEVTTNAEFWCYNCEEGLCLTCFGHHKISKSLCDHKIINIKSYKLSNKAIETECDKHGQQLNLYCPSHLMPCCDECIPTSHTKCTGIKSLASVVEKTKMVKSKEFLDKDITSILYILNKMVINKSENIKRGEQQCESIKSRIIKFRKKINEHLDKLEKKLYQETNTILNEEKSNASDLINEIEEKIGELDGVKDYLHAFTTHNSKLQSFLRVHQIEQQVNQYQQYVEDLEGDDRNKEFDIKMEQNNEMEKTLKKLESLESLAVTVIKKDKPMNRKTSVSQKAQVQLQPQSNINKMTMNIETKIDINMEKSISDLICLMDGRVVVVKQSDTVSLLTSDGKLQKELPIPGRVVSVTQINHNIIAMTYPGEGAIRIFNMENETVTKVITLDKPCYGISSSNNSLAVGLEKDEIRIMDIEGNTLKSIQVESKSSLFHLVYCNDRVIYSDYLGKKVYCVNGSGKQIWKYTDLSEPWGLSTDSYGNIFVADNGSHRIIVISKDGQKSKELTNENELELPRCICFSKHNESSGFICDFPGTYLVKFNLSHE